MSGCYCGSFTGTASLHLVRTTPIRHAHSIPAGRLVKRRLVIFANRPINLLSWMVLKEQIVSLTADSTWRMYFDSQACVSWMQVNAAATAILALTLGALAMQ